MLLWMPLTGWLYNSASNFPLRWFGLFAVPALSGRDQALKELAESLHSWGFYLLGILSATFHLANGIWSFSIVWGLTVGPRAQRRMMWVSAAVFVVLSLLGIGSIRAFRA